MFFSSSFKRNISWLMFLGIVINYLDRVNISSGILLISKEFHLGAVQQGVILSAFSWGYVLLMLPSGILVDRFGPKTLNAVSCVVWSIFTLLTAAANGFAALLLTRFFIGAAEAPIFPGNAKVVSTWFELNERGRATAIFDIGSYVGGAIATPIIIFMMLSFGWRSAFIFCSLLGLGWSLMWSISWLISYRSPQEMPPSWKTSLSMKHWLSKNQLPPKAPAKLVNQDKLVSIWRVVKQRKVMAASLGFFCYNYLKSFFLTWFPTYLIVAHHFTILKVGIISIIPPLCAIICELTVGLLTDKLVSRGIDVTIARKVPLCLGLVLSSVVLLSEFTNNGALVIILLSFSYACLISASASIWSIPADIAPNKDWVGTVGGIQNTLSNLAGIAAPIITGLLFSLTGSFLAPLAVSAILGVVGASAYWFGTGKLERMIVPGIPTVVDSPALIARESA